MFYTQYQYGSHHPHTHSQSAAGPRHLLLVVAVSGAQSQYRDCNTLEEPCGCTHACLGVGPTPAGKLHQIESILVEAICKLPLPFLLPDHRHALQQRAVVPNLPHMQPAVTQLEHTHTETTSNTLSARNTHMPALEKRCVLNPSPATTSTAGQHRCRALTATPSNTAAAVLHLAEPQLLLQESKAASILS